MGNKLDNVTDGVLALNKVVKAMLGTKSDIVMNLDGREFGRVINEHIGEGGSYPISLKG